MGTILQRNIRNILLIALALLLPIGLISCGAPIGPGFTGRFLYLPFTICNTEPQFSVWEYRTGMDAPTPLWMNLPCQTHSNELAFPISSDGHFAMLILNGPFIPSTPPYFSLSLLDLTSGEFKSLPAPEYSRLEAQSMNASGAFSPDDRYFAYTVNSSVSGPNRLYLLNLASGESSILFESPCAPYNQTGMGMGSNFCASVGNPVWIDATTLVFSGFSGELPQSIVLGNTIHPNHTFVMSLDGTVLQGLSPALHIGGVYGPTLLYYVDGQVAQGYEWTEMTDLKQGQLNPHLLDVNSQFLPGKVGDENHLFMPSISPDGEYAFQRIGSVWHLIGLRNGSDKKILNTSVKTCYSLMWAPDQKNVMCRDSSQYNAIISLEGYRDQRLPYSHGMPFGEDIRLFAWLP